MTWFKYFVGTKEEFAPVRRLIVFPDLSEKLKIGDWIHVNLGNVDIGRYYYLQDGLIKSSFDTDAYIVVYEDASSKTPTFNLIVDSESSEFYKKNLWFKSLTAVDPGSKPSGNYYIYYHKNNIQYVALQSGQYTSTFGGSQENFIATLSQNSLKSINYFSTEVYSNSNNRVAALGFLGNKEVWLNGQSSSSGAKLVAPFNGPRLKIYSDKNRSSGIFSLKIIKASASGEGQKVVKENIEIDLYSATPLEGELVYSLDMQEELLFSTYEELYGEFYFEITVLNSKNKSASSIGANVIKYSFSKNYELQFDSEEIKTDLAFKTMGGIK